MRKAINYDVGMRATPDWPSRPVFDPAAVREEMRVIRHDLGCTAVRIFGEDLGRLTTAAESALDEGLEVWFSPDLHNSRPRAWLAALADAADAAERLRSRGPVVFVVGRELTFFMRGLVLGRDAPARMRTFTSVPRLLANLLVRGSFNRRLGAFLSRAVPVVRTRFRGPVTYAAGSWEQVDWAPFDIVSADLYRDAAAAAGFRDTIRACFSPGKPVAITEFGCCTYRGAAARGGMGWAVVDRTATPPRLKERLVRDEEGQAAEVTGLMDVFAAEGADVAFLFTFASYSYPHSPDPALDLDLAAYGIVSCLPDGSWRPKKAFHAFAAWPAGNLSQVADASERATGTGAPGPPVTT
ncbi:hypothetical protein Pth03_24400 [Planotetraspora thailandica]|uniref:Abortive infection protein n=1 Tax=Planotetraspora thailandica TaxID=487172 RepID=A0A8J3XVU7_9ACTN|nr:hypothetical protein [Planotetraspora thailandica]GII54051.1 hypothetical protein Pth03_24400 [Planotetraspora thailandica]